LDGFFGFGKSIVVAVLLDELDSISQLMPFTLGLGWLLDALYRAIKKGEVKDEGDDDAKKGADEG
jgi:hypothetical protein